MYHELAEWWHLLSDPSDYTEEAGFFAKILLEAGDPPPRSVLELGSGGGNNASHLKAHFDMTLSDVSPEMIEMSRKLNPECEHVVGDMRSLRLERTFDAVFAHDAIMYMLTEDDLRAAMTTLFVPDFVSETFRGDTRHGGHDGPTRSMRYLEWDHAPDEASSTFVTDFAFLLRDRDGAVRVEHDTHTLGLFARDAWPELLVEAGFELRLNRREPYGREIFVGARPI